MPLRPDPTSLADRLIAAADNALRTVFATPSAKRALPTTDFATANDRLSAKTRSALTDEQQRLSGALMRVNHVGEVCAQALYAAQTLACTDAAMRAELHVTAQEEADHLAWTQTRLDQLGASPSRLNPLWYAGSFALGLAAAFAGDRASRGFIVETEHQVEAHLSDHLARLPEQDQASRAILEAMREDEIRHAEHAAAGGASELPPAVQRLMRATSKVMTGTAFYI